MWAGEFKTPSDPERMHDNYYMATIFTIIILLLI